MLTHIVIWKYRADVEQEVRDEHVAMLRKLAGTHPEIQTLSVGSDVLRLPRSYDTGLVATSQTAPRSRLTPFIPNTSKLLSLARVSAST